MAKDAAGIFVHRVEEGLLGLLADTAGPHAVYVPETDFERNIRTCVLYFYWENGRQKWVSRNVEDGTALEIIKRDIRPVLERHAASGTSTERYSEKVQAAFENVWRYVREWLGEGATETRGADRMQELLAALHKLLEQYDT